MKKFSFIMTLAVAFALTATVAFAGKPPKPNHPTPNQTCCGQQTQDKDCCPSVEVNTTNNAAAFNTGLTNSNTGGNTVFSGMKGFTAVNTGAAYSVAQMQNSANGNDIAIDQPESGKVEVNTDNGAMVGNLGTTNANTGNNMVTMPVCSMTGITTGNATSSNSMYNLVNQNVIRVK